MRRIVVTGVGCVTPLGDNADTTWKNIVDAKSGVEKITDFNVSDLPAQIAASVPKKGNNGFNPSQWMDEKEQKKVDLFIIYAMAAATQALNDAGWKPQKQQEQNRTGTLIGSGIGGLEGIAKANDLLQEKGPRRISPFFIPGRLINLASGYVSIEHGLKGPNHSVVTACSTGAHAIGDAARMIAFDDADVMVAGGAESPLCRLAVAGFAACKALSTKYNDTPEKASRPWDENRDGFVMGEGAGIVVLEEMEHAKARGAKIYGEIIGYGLSGDAHHITAPAPNHDGAYRAMQHALRSAKIDAKEIDYINAHGTSTAADTLELQAVERLVGENAEKLAVSSTKSAIGHLLGAAGSVEAILCLLAMENNMMPPTLNLDKPETETPIDLVAHNAKEKELNTVLSNSFGFGGTNACLIFRKIK